MYPPNTHDIMKSPPPSAPPPPANYGYGQPAPATGIPVSTQSYTNIESFPAPPPPHFQATTPAGYWSSGLCDCGSDVSNCKSFFFFFNQFMLKI